MVFKKGALKDHWRGRDFYVRVINYMTGDGIRNVKQKTSKTWATVTVEDRQQWYLLHRIAHHSRIAPILDMPKTGEKSKLEAASAEHDKDGPRHGTQTWSGYGFVLSWNTDLGQDDPDVIKLVQSGKVGEDLFRSMRSLTLYQEAFMRSLVPRAFVSKERNAERDRVDIGVGVRRVRPSKDDRFRLMFC